MSPSPSRSADVTVPGSVRIGFQPDGYAICAAPFGSTLACQPRGAGLGRSQANACGSFGAGWMGVWADASSISSAELSPFIPEPQAERASAATRATAMAVRPLTSFVRRIVICEVLRWRDETRLMNSRVSSVISVTSGWSVDQELNHSADVLEHLVRAREGVDIEVV